MQPITADATEIMGTPLTADLTELDVESASASDIIAAFKADADLGTGANGMVTRVATAATEVVKIHRAATAVTAGGPVQRHLENVGGDTLETVYEVIDGDPA